VSCHFMLAEPTLRCELRPHFIPMLLVIGNYSVHLQLVGRVSALCS
jgi:hypothetical protein